MTLRHWEPSKYLLQAAPPDMGEGGTRWTFALYEILDKRNSPMEPRVVHAYYLGVVELDSEEMGDVKDGMFSAKLEETVIQKWKSQR